MSPTTKESELGVSPGGAQSASGTGSASKPQPVALEIPVTVNGARTVDGSDKREPFSETTQTVLVFGNGAVIRLSSSVAPGQLLFLTNEKTKKEVVCQVVKSKNYRNVSGYVELEFTEMAVGFWGVRFPEDQITVKPVAPRPVPAVNPASVSPAPVAPKPPALDSRASEPSAQPPSSASLTGSSRSIQASSGDAARPHPRDAEVQALRQEAARLQEQLSSLNLGKSSGLNPIQAAVPLQPSGPPKSAEVAPKQNQPAKYALPALPSGPDDSVKIPSWLEPLARNAGSTTSETPASQEPQLAAALPAPDEYAANQASSERAGHSAPLAMPSFGGMLLEESGAESAAASAGRSKKGLLAGAIAATVLLAGGGAWYARQAGVFGSAGTAGKISFHEPAQAASNSAIDPQTQLNSAVNSAAAPPASETRAGEAPDSARAQSLPAATPQPLSVREVEKIPADASAASPGRAARAVREEPQKPEFGEVHFAAPTVNSTATEEISAGEPNLGAGQNFTGSAPSASGLVASHAKQPVAPPPPVAIGGEVKQAKLISSARPVYPPIAKAQHVSGNVVVDALIDEQGRVTTMKIISGPSLLHQSAMEALRRWRYEPATLDGKPVPMHLTVTLQFRLQ